MIPLRPAKSLFPILAGLLFFLCAHPAFGQGGVWATRAPMPTARGGFGVGTINGKVYVVGGQLHNSATMTGTVEAYDTATNT
jgi:hypothetical protein